MDSGFQTIGNATLICHDNGPVLVTDPWLDGNAYFGSWTLSHQIPLEQRQDIEDSKFVWLSHGHPDHLSIESLRTLKDKTILLADHVGSRISDDLTRLGFKTTILKDRTWTPLSPRLKVISIADYNQDSILLVDINGALIINTNDTSPRGWAGFIRETIKDYKETFLLQLFGYGDADMINYFDENGVRIEPRAALKMPVGPTIVRVAEGLGIRYVVPFSSLHKYQRSDSIWANDYITPLLAYQDGFDSNRCELLPAFINYDTVTKNIQEIDPPVTPELIKDPSEFGDDWRETLEKNDVNRIKDYFQSIHHLGQVMDFINVKVGGEDNIIELGGKNFQKGIMFEAPKASLMRTIRYRIFDDLLIGNFAKTTMIGRWPSSRLYPDFTPYVGKYADNGLARSQQELKDYFKEYRKRDPMEYVRHRLQIEVASVVRGHIDSRSPIYQTAQRIWWLAMGRRIS